MNIRQVQTQTLNPYSLSARYIAQAATQMGWEEYEYNGVPGWKYPIRDVQTGEIVAYRWKRKGPGDGPKYVWIGKKPGGGRADFYAAPDIRQAIAVANGAAYMVNGEPALLAALEIGLRNTLCTTGGETTVPKGLAETLQALGVTTLYYIADNDKAGTKGAIKFRDALLNSGIEFRPLSLQGVVPDKGDLNDVLIQQRGNLVNSRAAVDALSALVLPEPQPIKPRKTVGTGHALSFAEDADYERALRILREDIARALNIEHFNAEGWGRRLVCSPFRPDENPTCSYNVNSGVLHDFGTGESHSPHELAAALGLDYPQRPRRKKSQRPANMQSLKDEQDERPWGQRHEAVELPTLTADLAVNLRYISDLAEEGLQRILKAGTALVRSPMGTGKMTLVERLVAQFQQEQGRTPSVLYIASLTNLCEDAAQRLDGFVSYQYLDDLEQMGATARITCTPNSLHKLGKRHFDIVVIDEATQTLEAFWGRTMAAGEHQRAWQHFTHFAQNARLLLGLDAHLTDEYQRVFEMLRQGPIFRVVNEYTHDWGQMTVAENATTVLAHVREVLLNPNTTQPVVIQSNSKQYLQRTAEWLIGEGLVTEDEMLQINGDTSSLQEIAAIAQNLDAHIGTYRVCLFSPSVGVGVDIQTPVQGVYAVMFKQPYTPAQMIQMLGRCRNAGERHVYFSPADFQDYETDAFQMYRKVMKRTVQTAIETNIDLNAVLDDFLQEGLLRVQVEVQAIQNRAKCMLFSNAIAMAEAEGFRLDYASGEDKVIRKALREAGQRLAEARKERTLTADPVTHADFDWHRKQGTATEEVQAGYLRFQIEDLLGAEIDGSYYDTFHQKRDRARLLAYVDFLDNPEQLKERDRLEYAEGVILSLRGHYTVQQQLAYSAIYAVFKEDGLRSEEELTRDEVVKRLQPFLKKYSDAIEAYINTRSDHSKDPLAVFRRILGKIGIHLDYRQIMGGGVRFMIYWIDQEHRQQWEEYARMVMRERQRKEAEQLVLLQTRREEDNLLRDSSNGEAAEAPEMPVGGRAEPLTRE